MFVPHFFTTEMESRKRRRGKFKNLMLESDDAAADMVTFRNMEVETPAGHIKKRVKVPLPPAPREGNSSKTTAVANQIYEHPRQLDPPEHWDADGCDSAGADEATHAEINDPSNQVNDLFFLSQPRVT